MKQYIIITMLNVVLYCFCFVFAFCLLYPCMAINVSIQYNIGLLADIILLTQSMLLPSGNPFKCHKELLSLQAIDPT